jgi:hypothetical protein
LNLVAYTYSDAFEKATGWAGDDILDDLIEQLLIKVVWSVRLEQMLMTFNNLNGALKIIESEIIYCQIIKKTPHHSN